ncbi:MAG: PKD domain-containing protein [Bacteroidota bacterium]
MNKANLKLQTLTRTSRKIFFAAVLLIITLNVSSQQYNATGTAFAMSSIGCYTLTNSTGQAGAIWNIYTIDLTQSFDITLTLNFGYRSVHTWDGGTNCGGDGMSFVLQPVSTGVFGLGSGVGFHGITPSLGVIMDTFTDNPDDPTYQHISINQNGDELDIAPNELTSYTAAVGFPPNITDGMSHLFRFSWDPTTDSVKAYFGNSNSLPANPTITYHGDIVNNIFGGNPNVYWGVSASTGGCWNLQTVCITTVANFIADSIVCYGTPVTFFDNSISGLAITSWLWEFGDSSTSIQQNPVHVYNAPGTYLVKLTIVNSGGFSSVMTHNVIVNPRPDVTVNNDSICTGDIATLTAHGANAYFWSTGQTDSAIQVSPPVTSTYIVTGENEFHCLNKDTATVTVFDLPIITVTNDTICKGDTATLTASGGTSYEWTTPYVSTSNPIKVSPDVPTQYTVIGTLNTHGCKNTGTGDVVFYPVPNISFSANKQTGCEPVTVTFTNETDPVNSTYTWNFGDGSPTDTTLSPIHTYNSTNSPFSVTLSAVSGNGCFATYTATDLISVYPQPTADFTWDPPTGVLSNPTIYFTDASTPVNPLFTNTWDFGDGTLPFDYTHNPVHLFTSANVFDVMMIISTDSTHGNCRDTVRHSITIIADSLGFPNVITPNGDGINDNFVIKGLEKGAYPSNNLVIYNRWGKKVYDSSNYQNGNFTGDGLPDGVYYYIFTAKSVLKELKHQSSLEILR